MGNPATKEYPCKQENKRNGLERVGEGNDWCLRNTGAEEVHEAPWILLLSGFVKMKWNTMRPRRRAARSPKVIVVFRQTTYASDSFCFLFVIVFLSLFFILCFFVLLLSISDTGATGGKSMKHTGPFLLV
eukprot:Hpha_TRINITY_DN7364_c0_g1::TRINITY_DN7364_c0_g1_i1::g.9973::m.9973